MDASPLDINQLDALLDGKLPEEPAVPAAAPETPQPNTVPPTTTETPTPETTVPAQTPPAAQPTGPVEEETPATLFTGGKQNSAFARMRVENNALTETVTELAGLLGLPTMDKAQAINGLKALIQAQKAEQQKVPVDTIRELDTTKTRNAQLEQEVYAQKAEAGFATLVTSYQLTNTELLDFSKQLLEAGVNPYTSDVDIVQEYRNRNFEQIMEKRVAAELAKNAAVETKAATHASTPVQVQGNAPSSPATSEIGSIKALDALLAGGSK